MAEDEQLREAYCPVCGEQTVVEVTVPWQADICTECRNSVPAEDD